MRAPAFVGTLTADAQRSLRLRLQPGERDVGAAVGAQAVATVGQTLKRGVKRGQFDRFEIGHRQIDFAVGAALWRVVAILQQYFAGVFGPCAAGKLRLDVGGQCVVTCAQTAFQLFAVGLGKRGAHGVVLLAFMLSPVHPSGVDRCQWRRSHRA